MSSQIAYFREIPRTSVHGAKIGSSPGPNNDLLTASRAGNNRRSAFVSLWGGDYGLGSRLGSSLEIVWVARLSVSPYGALTPGVDGGLSAVGEVELREDVRDVALNRLLADEEVPGDLGVAEAVGDQAQHLQLPVGELAEHVGRLAARPAQLAHNPGGHARVEDGLARGGLADRIGELDLPYLFEEIRERPGADGGEDVLVVVVGGQD